MAKKTANQGKATTEPLYYITNQYNLREILSGGYIGSRESFDDKYYDDLLVECPGRIPLFTLPIDASLFQKVNAHDPETSFAAVLQIDPASLETDYSFPITEGGIQICIAYAGVISLKSVSTIHFLTAENRSEFEVRSYSNMPNPKVLVRVSPELAQSQVSTPDILQKLKGAPEAKSPTADDFFSLDRIGGAISLCICRSEGKDQSKYLLRLLDPPAKRKKTAGLPAWFNLGFEKKTREELFKLTDINELIFASAISVLYSYGMNTAGQRQKILDQIKGIIDSHPSIGENKDTLDKSFAKIERVLQTKDDFEPFRPGTGYDAIRGLLLFLMRTQPKDLLSHITSELNPSQPVMLTALAYSGIVIGRKGLDTEYRPAKTDQEIAGLVVEDLNRICKSGKPGSKSPSARTVKDRSAGTHEGSAVAVSGQLVKALSIDWKTLKEGELDVKKGDPEFLGAAVWLCREKGWKGCVSTLVNWAVKDNFSLQPGQKTELTLKVFGFLEISYELNFEQFKIILLNPETHL